MNGPPAALSNWLSALEDHPIKMPCPAACSAEKVLLNWHEQMSRGSDVSGTQHDDPRGDSQELLLYRRFKAALHRKSRRKHCLTIGDGVG